MKKFITAIDGLRFSESAVRYSGYLASQSHAYLTGVFLDDFTHHSYKIYEMLSDTISIEAKKEELEEGDLRTRQESADRFQQICSDANVNFNLHRDRSFAIQELLHECIYADLLFVDGNETFMTWQENPPTKFIRALLANVECPVFITPSQYTPIKKVILLYDGAPSSVQAVRMFSYLLPSLKSVDIEIVTVQMGNETLAVPDKRLMTEFMERHFPGATYKVLRGLPETTLVNYLKSEDSSTLVVLGAYRRGMVSRWFRPSMADTLMANLRIPLFIAHN